MQNCENVFKGRDIKKFENHCFKFPVQTLHHWKTHVSSLQYKNYIIENTCFKFAMKNLYHWKKCFKFAIQKLHHWKHITRQYTYIINNILFRSAILSLAWEFPWSWPCWLQLWIRWNCSRLCQQLATMALAFSPSQGQRWPQFRSFYILTVIQK